MLEGSTGRYLVRTAVSLIALALAGCSIDRVEFTPLGDGPGQPDTGVPGAVALVMSASELTVTEAEQITFTVALSNAPQSAITVELTPGDKLGVSPASLTFQPTGFASAQTVTVTGREDADILDEQQRVDVVAAGVDAAAVTVTVIDNDVLRIIASPASLDVGEGATGSFKVRLSHAPAADVVVGIQSSDPAAVSVAGPSLTFTTASWDTEQTVDVNAPQDDDVADEAAQIALTATGLTERSVNAAVDDDDVQAILVTPRPLAVLEGATATLQVRLAFRPAADVIVTPSSLSPAVAIVVAPASLTFEPASYDTPQDVTIRGVADPDAVPASGTIRLESVAGGLLTDAPVGVTDDDALTIAPTVDAITVGEGASSIFHVRLTAMPLATVSVTVSSLDATIATASPSTLTFTPADWDQAQRVVVDGTEDIDLADESVAIRLSANGFANREVTASVIDNDNQRLVVSPLTVNLDEGNSGTIGVRLEFQPLATTTVNISSANAAIATVDRTTLTFTPANFATPQNVTISAPHDDNVTGISTTVTLSVPPANVIPVTVNVIDDDVLAIVTTTSAVSLSEAGSASFDVRLSAQPAGLLTVSVESSDPGAATVTPSRTFDPFNWHLNQTITVTGVNDPDPSNESVTLRLSAPSVASHFVSAAVVDDDIQALVVSRAALTVAELNTGGDTFTVRLAAQPSGTTGVSILSSDASAARVVNPLLTFTPADWDRPQQVVVRAVDDADLDHEAVTVTVASLVLDSRQIDVSVADDDLLSVFPDRFQICQLTSNTFEVALNGPPFGGAVTVSLHPVGPVTIDAASLDFTAAGTRSVTFNVVDAAFIEIAAPRLRSQFVTFDRPGPGEPDCDATPPVCGDGLCEQEELSACNCFQDCPFACP